jgi:cyclase
MFQPKVRNLPRILWPVALLGGIILSSVGAAQDRPVLTAEQQGMVQIRPVPGKADLYVIPGFDGNLSGGNVVVLASDTGVLIVDNKYSYSYPDIMEQVRKVSDQPVRYVLNTHHHFDHAGSNADFMAVAPVLAHRNVRDNILRNESEGAPEIIYDLSAAVFLDGIEVQAHHFGRGHTNGDSVIYFPSLGTVHTGDLFIWGERLDGSTLAPFIDYDNGGSAAEWTATLDGLLALDFDTVIPGHGPVLRKSDVRIFRSKFDQLVSRIQILIDNGTSRDELISALDISDLDWPLAPARLQAIYDELAL